MDKLTQLTSDYLSAKSNLLDYIFNDEDISSDEKWRRLLIVEDSKLLPVIRFIYDFEIKIKHLFDDTKQKELYDKICKGLTRYAKVSLVDVVEQCYGDESRQEEVLNIVWNWVKISKVIGFTNDW